MKKEEELEEEEPEKEELDWWSKYYASLEELEKQVSMALFNFLEVWINKTVLVHTVYAVFVCRDEAFSQSIDCFLFQEEKDDDMDDPQDGGELVNLSSRVPFQVLPKEAAW